MEIGSDTVNFWEEGMNRSHSDSDSEDSSAANSSGAGASSSSSHLPSNLLPVGDISNQTEEFENC